MTFKLNTLDTYENCFKKAHRFNRGSMSKLVYDKHNGLFAVEAEAVESCAEDICSPYNGKSAEEIID